MMHVKLISYTKIADTTMGELADKSGYSLQDIIAFTARVSNPGNQNNAETSDKLIRYLIKNKHWSPFESVSLTIEIYTTRDIGRQILRHRSFTFQEFSQRYATVEYLGWCTREARLQDSKNRQSSITTEDANLKLTWDEVQYKVWYEATKAYEWALEKGIAKEVARSVLPEGLVMTRMYMTGSLRSWITYIALRLTNGTQKEHRDVAQACAEVIKPVFPMIDDAVSSVT